MPGRPLFPAELKIAWRVFMASLPYHKVLVTPFKGLESRPFTTPIPLFPPATFAIAYQLHVGLDAFRRGLDETSPRTLIHELTHVWQGAHSFFVTSFVLESLAHQGAGYLTGVNPYRYTPGQPWKTYNVEQQAEIVEDWFVRGESTTDANYRYITDDIRSLLWYI
jgi:hypothetical protein